MTAKGSKGEDRPVRVNRIAKRLAARAERWRHAKGIFRRPLRHKARRLRLSRMIAYDLETTPIKAGNPEPRYVTAYTEGWTCSLKLSGIAQLRIVLQARFLTDEFTKARFVAWNGNNFDVYLVAQALLACDDYILRPYLTRSKNLRGLKVIDRANPKRSWEFLDGISMTIGNAPMTLKKFVERFAPDYGKLQGPDFEAGEVFDADNPAHVRYAERDSEGLYHALQAAEKIVVENFGIGLQPTVGNMGIKIFQANMPEMIDVWEPPYAAITALRDQVMRGGFCYCARKHEGPIWKYDLNQSYAAAMREARLPGGRCIYTPKGLNRYATIYIAKVRGINPRNKVPFYYRTMDKRAGYCMTELSETWLTSLEIEQLKTEGWKLEFLESFFWNDSFTMKGYVDKLEQLRVTAPGGPNGAQGTMIKSIGNNSYGKTVEQLDGMELVMALEKPSGFHEYQCENDELQNVWFKFGKPILREYHQPQLGAFITAHVRMQVRRAILKAPEAWLYADTDCVIFERPVSLPIDPMKYGLWKVEAQGEPYRIITKKVYADFAGKVRHAKGMNVKRLSGDDFIAWYRGDPPRQLQVHRQNFVKFVTGQPMFTERRKIGQKMALG
ncbi:MAG: DNA polymerase [Methylocella sp.]